MSGSEIYWLTRLASLSETLSDLSFLMFLVSLLGGGALAIFFCFKEEFLMDSIPWEKRKDEEFAKKQEQKMKDFSKSLITTFFILVVVTLILITMSFFCPSKNDLIAIYGGSYLTSNKETENLPFNAAKALNKLATNYIKKGDTK